MKRASAVTKASFPVTVERGPVGLKGRATIHRTPVEIAGKRYDSFTVVFYQHSKRQRQRFNDYAKAFARAEEIATKLSNGESTALALNGDDRRMYVGALDALKHFPDVALDLAAREYVQARKILGDVLLLQAAKFYER